MPGAPSKRGSFEAVVRSNERTGEGFYRMTLELAGPGADAFSETVPGQFAELDISRASLPPVRDIPPRLRDSASRDVILRRPFSFTDVTDDGGRCFAVIFYKAVGPATLRMASFCEGNTLGVIGPLGNGYRVPGGKSPVFLVSGGMGAPPLQHLARFLRRRRTGVRVIALAGARTAAMLPFTLGDVAAGTEPGPVLREFAECGADSLVATDDGSVGYRGLVSGLLAGYLERNPVEPGEALICGCGPEAMLAAVAGIAAAGGIDCQVGMERRMACGTGICQGCAVECRRAGSDRTVYKLCCLDGPVFDSREVVFLDK
jgi:dihydroorotate dehydrogenase electron transfer subunit